MLQTVLVCLEWEDNCMKEMSQDRGGSQHRSQARRQDFFFQTAGVTEVFAEPNMVRLVT
jgi:hypothetical protein